MFNSPFAVARLLAGTMEFTQPLNLTQARLDALRLALVASATSSWMVLCAFQLQAKFGSEVFYHGLIVESASTSKNEGHQTEYLEVKLPRFKANSEGLVKCTFICF